MSEGMRIGGRGLLGGGWRLRVIGGVVAMWLGWRERPIVLGGRVRHGGL